MRAIHIGVLGLGNVGAGVVRILRENREAIERRVSASLQVRRVLVRDKARTRGVEVAKPLLTTEWEDILGDSDIRLVVELIGGIEPARTYVLQALEAGKHVVTANKALLAEHGAEIFALASRKGLTVAFEGSVAGGVPVLRVLREGLASDHIEGIVGIVNGTSNYVLDAMTRTGQDYDAAVRAAQDAGFAEADPTLDVEGGDAAHKLALLTLLAFGMRVDPDAIWREGITGVQPFDIDVARRLGFVIKSLAIAELHEDESLPDGRPCLRVHPTLVPSAHILAGVQGSYNAVAVESRALGRSLYYGRGAGMMPTGMSVVSDIIEVGREIVTFAQGGPPPEAFQRVDAVEPSPIDLVECEHYLCVHVPNVPGVLGRVATCLGRHGVSIKQMHQDTPGPGEPIDMVIITETTADAHVARAVEELDTFEDSLAPTRRFRILPNAPID